MDEFGSYGSAERMQKLVARVTDLEERLAETEQRLKKYTIDQVGRKANKENTLHKEADVVDVDAILDFTGTMGNSAKDPTADAPGDWQEVKVNGTTLYGPLYNA